MRRTRAFTLIELLVVISIVALLVALLLPALAKARLHAEAMSCLARIRGMTVAMRSYTLDNRGYFPALPYNGGVPTTTLTNWPPYIVTYMGYQQVLPYSAFNHRSDKFKAMHCPSVVTGTLTSGYPHWLFSLSWGLQTTYKDTPTSPVNSGAANWDKFRKPHNIDVIQKPSDIFMFVDGGVYQSAWLPGNITPITGAITAGVYGYSAPGAGSPNHNGLGNALSHIDGHAQFVRTLEPFVHDPRAAWNLKSAWLPNSQGYVTALTD